MATRSFRGRSWLAAHIVARSHCRRRQHRLWRLDSVVRTKIVSTIGPATRARDKIHALAELGVDLLRLNFAHGKHEEHAEVIKWAREAGATNEKPLAILADLGGPKIRIGHLPEPVQLTDKTRVILAPEEDTQDGELPTQ